MCSGCAARADFWKHRGPILMLSLTEALRRARVVVWLCAMASGSRLARLNEA